MESLKPTEDVKLHTPKIPNLGHLTAALAEAANTLSLAKQIVTQSAQALSAASRALSALDNLDLANAQAAQLPVHRAQLVDKELKETRSESDSALDNQKSAHPNHDDQHTVERITPHGPSRSSRVKDKSKYEPNDKLESDIEPLQADPGVSAATSALQTNNSDSRSKETDMSVVPEDYVPIDAFPKSSVGFEFDVEHDNLRDTIDNHVKLPPGCNCIRIDHHGLDETSVAAYLALQSSRTICIIDEQMGVEPRLYATILGTITNSTVFCPEIFSDVVSVGVALHDLSWANPPAILLLSQDVLPNIQLRVANPDCIVHWGIPVDFLNYVSQMSSLPPNVRSCLLLSQEEDSDLSNLENCDIVQYPDVMLETCFGPASPFQTIRKVSTQVIAMNASHFTYGNAASKLRDGAASVTTAQGRQLTRMPAGHYYILTPGRRILEVVSLMSYIALRSEKTMCYFPPKRDLDFFQEFIESVTNLMVVRCSSSGWEGSKKPVHQSTLPECSIFLRHASDQWSAHLTEGLADSLVHWGAPPSIEDYVRQCKSKLRHSCLILTPSQYGQVMAGRSEFPLERHPLVPELSSPPEGSLLHIVCAKVAAYL